MQAYDLCECCGRVEVYDGKVCKRCEEVAQRNYLAALDGGKILDYNKGE